MDNIMYDIEKKKMKKKLKIVGTVTGVMTGLLVLAGGLNFFGALAAGFACSMVAYIPKRIKDRFNCNNTVVAIITAAYLAIILGCLDTVPVIGVLMLLIPVGDIAYSIYKVNKWKKS